MEKINVAELLKDCPKGMELDCTICNNRVILEGVVGNGSTYPIRVISKDGFHHMLTCSGGVYDNEDSKCVIFPKGKTTWEGFVPPCQFKDGDIVVAEDTESFQLFLLKHLTRSEDYNDHDGYCYFGWDFQCNELFEKGNWGFNRLATEEEKQYLFDTIKDNGYKWNEETKTLEKLIQPKFKVGDRIRQKGELSTYTISDVNDAHYFCGKYVICDTCDDNWELVPNKFDINTLRAFDKVLMRSSNAREWVATFYSHYSNNKFYGCGMCCDQCIPYEGNEHLLGTTNDCDEYFKTWE